ncbi:hypothetical protein DPM33_16200 [Mesorhizobium hawassense]|uniref:Uncharacterized protein n=1 Tax=Mesorhizobium hawassense TaxID=1209954 RepID=A0A330HM30_9HYPH|nr:hypothetical protein [Mesorhizobium hawassense]RAZ89731.1 hypothetical protein DPM33_16200 [Mesorhizobium hawassense]
MTKPLQTRRWCFALAALAGALMAGTALADESSSQKLPGVSGDYRIAKPAPQPEPDDALAAGSDGSFKIGNTDVRIGGSITIDIATGGTRIPNH